MRAALLAMARQALTAESGHAIEVVLDWPSANSNADDIVAVGRMERAPTPFGMVGSMGQGAISDEVTVHVVVEVFRAGYDPQAVADRAFALAEGLEQAVRADPTLAGVAMLSRVTQGSYECQADDDHKGLIGTYEVAVSAKNVI